MESGIALPAITNILLGLMIIALSIPLLANKVSMNQWYGVRFERSFKSIENWYKINKYGAGRMVCWAIVMIAIGIVSLFLPVHENSILQMLLVGCPPLLMIIPAIEMQALCQEIATMNDKKPTCTVLYTPQIKNSDTGINLKGC